MHQPARSLLKAIYYLYFIFLNKVISVVFRVFNFGPKLSTINKLGYQLSKEWLLSGSYRFSVFGSSEEFSTYSPFIDISIECKWANSQWWCLGTVTEAPTGSDGVGDTFRRVLCSNGARTSAKWSDRRRMDQNIERWVEKIERSRSYAEGGYILFILLFLFIYYKPIIQGVLSLPYIGYHDTRIPLNIPSWIWISSDFRH